MIRILNAEPFGYCKEAREILDRLGEVIEAALNREQLIAELSEYDVLIVRLAHKIDREVIDAGSRLKTIVTATTGLDHIDVDYACSRGIAVLSLQGEPEFLQNINATAEHTWALLLALMRRIPQAFLSVRAGEWDRDRFRGNELKGKRLGIIGFGRLGRRVACYGIAFEMAVAAFDPYAKDWMEGVARLPNLSDLLRSSDIVSLHVPLNDETAGMIEAHELVLMHPGSVLVNTSRGGVVNEADLIQALKDQILAGAALDVMSSELDQEKRRSSPLMFYASTHENLLITPHIGGATHEAMFETEVFMARKLARYLNSAGKEPAVL
jgi:D-3-phosphoglycerate dehydrogenase